MHADKKGFRAFAEQDKARRLAKAVSDSADVNAESSSIVEPASVPPAVNDEPKLAVDRS